MIAGLIFAAIISGGVALSFKGSEQTARNESSNVGNLPATNANVDKNEQAIIDLRDQLSQQIDAAIGLVRAEINRRETETIKYVDTLDEKTKQRVDALSDALNSLLDKVWKHLQTPPSKHDR